LKYTEYIQFYGIYVKYTVYTALIYGNPIYGSGQPYTCTHPSMHTTISKHAHTHVCAHVSMHTQTHVSMRTHYTTHMHVPHTYMHSIHKHAHTHARTHTCTREHAQIPASVQIHTHAHTHTHTCTHKQGNLMGWGKKRGLVTVTVCAYVFWPLWASIAPRPFVFE